MMTIPDFKIVRITWLKLQDILCRGYTHYYYIKVTKFRYVVYRLLLKCQPDIDCGINKQSSLVTYQLLLDI
jgi:hypothetical protein